MGCFVAQATDAFNEGHLAASFFWLHMGRLRYILPNQTENTAFQAVVAQRFSCEDRLEDRGLMGLRVQLLPRWDFTENFLGSLVISRTVAQARSSRVFLQMASNSRSNNQLLVFAVL